MVIELQDVVAVAVPGLGVLGLGFGLYQYWIAQKWKKSEFASKQLEMLSVDPKLAMCCLFLDWSTRKIAVPEGYKIYCDEDEDDFTHKYDSLVLAMRPEGERKWYPFPQVLYRDYFDHFFGYLERVNHYLKINLFSEDDVASLTYWLRQVAAPRNAPADVRASCFRDYVRDYGYTGVEELMNRFGIKFAEA